MSNFSIKIKTSIISVFVFIVMIIVSTMIFFQYKSSNEFAMLTTQKVFDKISDQVVNKIQTYDSQSKSFIDISREIDNIDKSPEFLVQHKVLPVMVSHIKNNNYIYSIYIGYKNDEFYQIINLKVSKDIKNILKTPQNARWLVIKHIKNNGKISKYKEYLDENLINIGTETLATDYKPTQRPWYKKALLTTNIIKTKPYIFTSLQQPGVTYSKIISKKNNSVLSLDISLSSLSALLEKQTLVKGSAAFIFKENGKVIGEVDNILNKKIDNLNISYKDAFIKDGKVLDLEEQKIIQIDGINYLKYTTLLKSEFNINDYLTIISPIDVILQPYKKKVYNTIITTLLVLLFIVMPIIFYTVKLIVQPILRLEEENKKIQNGEFETIKPIHSFMMEIQSLSNSLVNMSNAIEESQRTLESKVELRTADLEKAKKEVEEIHKQTRDSIEYASLIQHTLIPDNDLFKEHFSDYLTIWHPKDIVGGDIYLFEELRHKDECLLLVIDCTGHGVPGAFVTMLVKAIERQIVSMIKYNPDEDVSPANLLSVFNKSMKHILKQDDKDSISNAGFDGGIIYYNKKDKILKYAGAETPLFYIDEDKELQILKGSRQSVGYKKCKPDFEYKEHIIKVKEGMQFYLTTDGYLDQNGGVKDFPFGKKRFGNIIKEYHEESLADQQEVFLEELAEYQGSSDRNDDVTLIAFKI